MSKPDISYILPDRWDYHILEDGRIVYFHLAKPSKDKPAFQWIPPIDTWKHLSNIILETGGIPVPFGIELAYDVTGNPYYLSHISHQTFRDFPSVAAAEVNQGTVKKLKEVDISRHPLVGYGFMLSKDPPLFVSHVVPGGPAEGKLIQGDLLYCIHGHDVTIQASTEDVLGALEKYLDPQVLQVAVVPKPKPRNKRPPPPPAHKAKVRFNTPLFEVMCEDDGTFIRIRAATGSEHVLRVTDKLTFDDVITALRDKLHMNCPVKTLGIVATRQSNRITLPPTLLVNQSTLRSSDGWKFHLRIRILPVTLDELSIRCPASLSYLYSQTCHDIYSGYFIAEVTHLAELLAIRIWLEFIRTYSSKSRSKKPNHKTIKKMGGIEVFLPRMWIERSTLLSKKDLCKQISNQISRCKVQTDELSIMLLFLKKCAQYISAFGGTLFHAQVEVLDKVTRICVSPAVGISEEKVSVNDIKCAPIYSPIVDFPDIVEVHLTEFSRRDDLSKVRICCVNNKELIFIMRLYDGCELGEVLQAYYRQRVQNVDILKDTVSNSLCKKTSPVSPKQRDSQPSSVPEHESISSTIQSTANIPIPPYQSTHLVPPQIWSYLFNSPSPPDTLMQFSPLNLPSNLSKKIRISSSGSTGSGSRVRESGGEFEDHLLATAHSDTYFTDSFDEVTDSESEEYTLEVPTQFLRESLERVNSIKEKENNEIIDLAAHMQPPDINIEVIPTDVFEESSSLVVPTILTGIPPPPILKGAEISFERLTNLAKTPPSPTGFDRVDETLSPFTSGFIPRSASDRCLKARSDTILSTYSWHSKYEHLYPRNLGLLSLPHSVEAKNSIYKTTHVDAAPIVLFTVKNEDDFPDDDSIENPNDSLRYTDILLNSESENSLLPFPLNSGSEQESDPNRIQIVDSSSNDLYSEQSNDDECIVLRLPPPVPTISHDEISDPIPVQIQVAHTQTLTDAIPNQTRALSTPSPPLLPPRMVAPIIEYKQPIARMRSNLRDSQYCPESVIITENSPMVYRESLSNSSPETLRRPPSMFADIDNSLAKYGDKDTIKIPLSSVQRIPIPRSSTGFRGVQAPMPAHRPLSNRIGYRPLPPKATPRRPLSSNKFISIQNQSSESDKPSIDPYSAIHFENDGFTSNKISSASDSVMQGTGLDLKLLREGNDTIQQETHSTPILQTPPRFQSLVTDTTIENQQNSAVISDQFMLIEPEASVVLSKVEIEILAQLLEPPLPTKPIDEVTTNEGKSSSQPLTTEEIVPISRQDVSKPEIPDMLMESESVNQPLGVKSIELSDISCSTSQSDADNVLYTVPTLNVSKTEEQNTTLQALLPIKPSSSGSTDTKNVYTSDPSSLTTLDATRFVTTGMRDQIKPIFSQEEPIKFKQNTPVMILTDPDPTRTKSMTEQLMQQFNIPDPETSAPTEHERLTQPTLPPLLPPEPTIVHPRAKPPNRMSRSLSPFSSRLRPDQLEEDSLLESPFNVILSVSQDSKDALSDVDSSNEIWIHRDSGLATSIESTHFPQHTTSPIKSIHIDEDVQKVKQPTMYLRAGNTEIRSARSIELFNRNPLFEPPQRSQLPPLQFPLQLNLSSVRPSYKNNPIEDNLSSSDDSSPPPIPTTVPPELGITDSIELDY